MQFCGYCGNKLEDSDKFCGQCGRGISTQTSLDINKPSTKEKGSYKRIFFILISAIILAGSAFIFKDNLLVILNKTDIVCDTDDKKTAPISVAPKSMGRITGDDVIVRSTPSVNATEVEYLGRNITVEVLDKNVCYDQNAAVLKMPKFIIYNSQRVQLHKGQIVDIVSISGNTYTVRVKVDNQWVHGVIMQSSELRQIYGDIWYKVVTNTGKTGWVFGEFVSLAQ